MLCTVPGHHASDISLGSLYRKCSYQVAPKQSYDKPRTENPKEQRNHRTLKHQRPEMYRVLLCKNLPQQVILLFQKGNFLLPVTVKVGIPAEIWTGCWNISTVSLYLRSDVWTWGVYFRMAKMAQFRVIVLNEMVLEGKIIWEFQVSGLISGIFSKGLLRKKRLSLWVLYSGNACCFGLAEKL